MTSLGMRIKQIRKQEGLNQTEFASKLGSTIGALSRYEIDKVIPNDVFIKHLCRVFHINEDWLRTGNGEMYLALTNDDKFSEMLGELLVSEDDQIKNIIMKTMELDDEDLTIIHQLVDRLLGKR
ncbi:MAG TPA: XRE family transcriptional regulator [Lysinibacillus sp.]|nr:XRE family transcriptional regulator [Lysinibacillus sp.]